MQRIIWRAVGGVMLASLLLGAIALTNHGAGLTTVLQAQTEIDAQAAELGGKQFPRRLHCTNGTIQGRYAVRTDGALVGVGPFAAVGIMTFDGAGSVTNAATTSTNGNIVSGTTTGTYSVNDDCSGQIAIPSVAGPPLTFNLIIADRGNEIALIATRAPAVLTGTGKRVD